ncbi:MAG: hypothetical protein AseanaTS_06390 [Candidatus Pelagadaptatus aseana]
MSLETTAMSGEAAAMSGEVTKATASNVEPATSSNEFEGLDLVGLNQLLEPIPELEPISLWPQTELWNWIFLVLFILILKSAFNAWRRWQANAYRRAACQEALAANNDTNTLASILRRTALAAYPRTQVASLYGDDWLKFLDQHCADVCFSEGPGRQLIEAPYRPQSSTANGDKLTQLVLSWIKGHHNTATEEPKHV